MTQFFIDPKTIQENLVFLKPNESKHLTKVLRYKKGDTLWVTDGEVRYLAVLETLGPKETVLKLLRKEQPILKAPAPTLGIALLKHDSLEWVFQKGVELGVEDFFLFVSERTIPHYRETATPKKMVRFEKIAKESAKQSGLVSVPKIHPPLSFTDLTEKFKNFSAVVLAWEQEQESFFYSVFQTIDPSRLLILIGPEGGFSSQEAAMAEHAGAKKISLGQRILRSETAAITLLALCQYELGNI